MTWIIYFQVFSCKSYMTLLIIFHQAKLSDMYRYGICILWSDMNLNLSGNNICWTPKIINRENESWEMNLYAMSDCSLKVFKLLFFFLFLNIFMIYYNLIDYKNFFKINDFSVDFFNSYYVQHFTVAIVCSRKIVEFHRKVELN